MNKNIPMGALIKRDSTREFPIFLEQRYTRKKNSNALINYRKWHAKNKLRDIQIVSLNGEIMTYTSRHATHNKKWFNGTLSHVSYYEANVLLSRWMNKKVSIIPFSFKRMLLICLNGNGDDRFDW